MFYQRLRYPLAQPSWHWKLPIMNKYVRLLRKPSLEISHRVSNLGLPRWHSCKESACQCRRCQKPGLGRSPGGGHGHPFQFSCLENPMDRGAKQASPWSSKESDMTEWLSTHTHTHTHTHTLEAEWRSPRQIQNRDIVFPNRVVRPPQSVRAPHFHIRECFRSKAHSLARVQVSTSVANCTTAFPNTIYLLLVMLLKLLNFVEFSFLIYKIGDNNDNKNTYFVGFTDLIK